MKTNQFKLPGKPNLFTSFFLLVPLWMGLFPVREIRGEDHPGQLSLKSVRINARNAGINPNDRILVVLFPESVQDQSLKDRFLDVFQKADPNVDINIKNQNFWAFTVQLGAGNVTHVGNRSADFNFPDRLTYLSMFAIPLTGVFAYSPEEIDEIVNTEANSSNECSGFHWRRKPDGGGNNASLDITLSFKWKETAGIPAIDFSFPVNSEKELFITDPAVLRSKRATEVGGAWHISTTMRRLQGNGSKAEVSKFTLDWLRSWNTDQGLNDDPAHRPRSILDQVIRDWIAASPGGETDLNWEAAPFRLIAIVNRIDLTRFASKSAKDNLIPSDLGEARLVYGLMRGQSPLLFNVIFEYKIPGQATRQNLIEWARQWRLLVKEGGANQFPESYLASLQAITQQYATKSHLSQVRTNERLLISPWELREFVLDAGTGALKANTVAMNPQQRFADTNPQLQAILKKYLDDNRGAIKNSSHHVPDRLAPNDTPFAGAVSHTPGARFSWKTTRPPGVSDHVISNFSLNTCNGCHGGDGPGVSFVHVLNRISPNQSDVLSPFLLSKQDRFAPDGTPIEIHEMEERGKIQLRIAVGVNATSLTEAVRNLGLTDVGALQRDFAKSIGLRANRTH